jgi:hypothetical protein
MPPKNFDPITADEKSLAHFGIPKRPDRENNPDAFKHWQRLFANSVPRIEPEFFYPDKPIHTSKPIARNGGGANGPGLANWAGAVVWGEVTGKRYVESSGMWVIPHLVMPGLNPSLPPAPSIGPACLMSTWVGLDGYDTPSVSQAGISQGIDISGSALPFLNGIGAWIEMWPASPVWVANFPVQVGDIVEVAVSVSTVVPNQIVASFINWTQVVGTAVGFGEYLFEGMSAEWIVESPDYEAFVLPDFGAVTFLETQATDRSGNLAPLSARVALNMEDSGQSVMAKSQIFEQYVNIVWIEAG